jgi:crotonobetainyl-CoA:carnitine CoA-transferase CaiB-like acyl-CoA transferase
MSDAESNIAVPPPTPGQHTGEILQELGFSEADFSAFREAGAI